MFISPEELTIIEEWLPSQPFLRREDLIDSFGAVKMQSVIEFIRINIDKAFGTDEVEIEEKRIELARTLIVRMLETILSARGLVDDSEQYNISDIYLDPFDDEEGRTEFFNEFNLFGDREALMRAIIEKTEGLTPEETKFFLTKYNDYEGEIEYFMSGFFNELDSVVNMANLTEAGFEDLYDGQDSFSFGSSADSDKVNDFLKFFRYLPQLRVERKNSIWMGKYLQELIIKKTLDMYRSNSEFMEAFNQMMDHDKRKFLYYYHGTQSVQDAENILKQGLGVGGDSITSTAYSESRMSPEQLLCYERGLGSNIGSSAVVVIAVPKGPKGEEQQILEPIGDRKINAKFSDLQELYREFHYYIRPEYIVGFVDKENQKVIFNPSFRPSLTQDSSITLSGIRKSGHNHEIQ